MLEGTTRTITQATRDWAREKIDQAAAQTAALYGGTAEGGLDGHLLRPLQRRSGLPGGRRGCPGRHPGVRIIRNRPFSLGGDNFAEFNRAVPGAYAYLGTGNPELPGTPQPGPQRLF